jgi:diaminobutyrate acetyltransferase
VGVVPEERGRGLARRLIETILARVEARGVTELQTTVTRSNEPSRALFRSLAREEGAEMTEHEMFNEEHFGDSGHEAEYLFRIRPLATPEKAS